MRALGRSALPSTRVFGLTYLSGYTIAVLPGMHMLKISVPVAVRPGTWRREEHLRNDVHRNRENLDSTALTES